MGWLLVGGLAVAGLLAATVAVARGRPWGAVVLTTVAAVGLALAVALSPGSRFHDGYWLQRTVAATGVAAMLGVALVLQRVRSERARRPPRWLELTARAIGAAIGLAAAIVCVVLTLVAIWWAGW